MVIVLILWKIKPGEQHEEAFLKYWAESLEIRNTSELVGEYLSSPMSADDAGFECGLFGLELDDDYYVPFINVGIWKSRDGFVREVIEPYANDSADPLPFEHERRRVVLSPQLWRVGNARLPSHDRLSRDE